MIAMLYDIIMCKNDVHTKQYFEFFCRFEQLHKKVTLKVIIYVIIYTM